MLVADTNGFHEFNNVTSITRNNITFAFNHNWLRAEFIAPDIIGLMSQSYYYQWNGGNFKVNDDGSTSRTEPDQRNEKEIVTDIANAKINAKASIDEFYLKVWDNLKMNQTAGDRYNFMLESPVPGSYFGQ